MRSSDSRWPVPLGALSSWCRSLSCAVVVALATIAGGQEVASTEATAGEVRGVVLDARDRPVNGAIVIICDQVSGLPLGANTRAPFVGRSEDDRHLSFDDWLFALTDESGAFTLEGIPAGEYRLIAQSWPETEAPRGPQEVNGLIVHLRGVVEHIEVPSEAAESVEITPLGDATFVYHRGAGNDDWYLFLSTGAPAADPILGPLGWKGPFLENAIGYARMPAAEMIVRGLPGQRIFYALFANDSRPGFGAGSFYARDGHLVAHDTNVVVGCSDGIHQPPKRLASLTDELRELMGSDGYGVVERMLVRGREEAWRNRREGRAFEHLFIAADILGPLTREIELPSGTRATVADILAAAGYVELSRLDEDQS